MDQGLCPMTLHFHADKERNSADNQHEHIAYKLLYRRHTLHYITRRGYGLICRYTELKRPAKVIKDKVQIRASSTSYQSFRDDLHGHLTRGESSSPETRRGVKG